jgi:uncharacterized protein (DUF2235 family)
MPKNIAILFDGTWNKPDKDPERNGDTNTNVYRLHDAIAPTDLSGTPQHKWYEAGVGSDWYDKIQGGMFGTGLSKKIMDGYRELVRHYEPGDRVYIFGFSRGAYSARSLAGMIRNVGLLRSENCGDDDMIGRAYSLYRMRDEGPDSPAALNFRVSFSREIEIECVGVWDTVGELGVPLQSFDNFNDEFYKFHDTRVSKIIKHAYHALAIDEHRQNFQPTMWDTDVATDQVLEQVWFSGAHANIGGGYNNDCLAAITLRWMADKAAGCGLCVDSDKINSFAPPKKAIKDAAVDSYSEFCDGLYRWLTRRHYRTLGQAAENMEFLDKSVEEFLKDEKYFPQNKVDPHLRNFSNPKGNRLK